MYDISDERFDELITRAMNELPQEYIQGLDNVVITMADEPTPEQIDKMQLREHAILLGLYEGIPLTQRGSGWSGMLPDKITLFKHSILKVVTSDSELFEQVKRTLWHEIAHYYGLSHADMHERQTKKSVHGGELNPNPGPVVFPKTSKLHVLLLVAVMISAVCMGYFLRMQ